MSESQLHEITLPLDDVQYLFTDPEPDSDTGIYVSGIDYLYSEVKTYPKQEKFTVSIVLPQEKISGDLEQRIKERIKRYCHFKIEENEKSLLALKHERFNALRVGITTMVICLLLGGIFTLVGQAEIDTVLQVICLILGQGFVIAGWVAMWNPIELVLYDWWPYRKDMLVYQQIADANIMIRAGKPASVVS